MNILQVISYFYPAWSYGGPPRIVYELCKKLVKRGHKVTVFTTDAFNAQNRVKETQEIADGIEVRRFRNLSNYIAFHHRIFLSPGMPAVLRREIRNYDILHLNDFRTLQNLTAFNNAYKFGVPYVLQANGSLPNIISKQRLKSTFDILFGRRILHNATKLIAVNPTEVEQYKSYGIDPKRISLIPYGINLEEFEKLPPRGNFREKYGLPMKDKVILFLGRLHKIKGIDLLINAFAGITKDFSNIKLVVAGPDDGFLPELRKLVAELELSEKVIFTGPLYGEDKLAAYVDADVYALTSSYEIFGISILEALSCGTPVVITDRCGIADIIKDKAGLVVPYDVKLLQDSLRKILQDELKRKQYARNGKTLVSKNFCWCMIAEKMEKVYQECLDDENT
jgi:glycosyltransferase involved in cell wall biosynthesis